MSRIWITWERQRRNQSMAAAFGAHLVEIDVIGSPLVRYATCATRTVRTILDTKPSIVFVQNPSFVLVLVASLVRSITKFQLVIDAHNSGVFPLYGRSRVLNWATRKLHGAATILIVSNDQLKLADTSSEAVVASLPDPLPHINCLAPSDSLSSQNVLFICSWADDEPFYNVIEAARLISPDVVIHMTGNHLKKGIQLPDNMPVNIRLTGFLPESEYDALLCASDVVVDLTTREDCLVCGAYEGVSAKKPLILSDTQANRTYFNEGTLYTDNSAQDLALQINSALAQLPLLTSGIENLACKLRQDWNRRKEDIEKTLQG